MKSTLSITSLLFITESALAHTDGSLHVHAEGPSYLSAIAVVALLITASFVIRRVLKKCD